MLKHFFIKQQIKSGLKRKRQFFHFVKYREAKNVGLIIDESDINSLEIKQLIATLTAEGKNITALTFHNDIRTEQTTFPYKFFTSKDINYIGRFRKYDIKKFIGTDFDYMLSLCMKSVLPIENILANCRAKCRVGFFNEEKKNFFDIMIKPASLKVDTKAVDEMLFYLKKINA